MKKVLSIVLAIVCLLAVTGFGGRADQDEMSARQEASAKKVLRVGTAVDYPPFAYYQAASKTHIGFDVELMQGLAREMGYDKVEFVNTDFNQLLPSLQEGKVDAVIACMTVTDERREAADFTASYLEVKVRHLDPFSRKELSHILIKLLCIYRLDALEIIISVF